MFNGLQNLDPIPPSKGVSLKKVQMARFIVHVLYHLDHKPDANHLSVKRLLRQSKQVLVENYWRALKALAATDRQENHSEKTQAFLNSIPKTPCDY